MEGLMSTIQTILEPLFNSSSVFVIFFVFTIVGLIIGSGIVNALRNGLLIAAGFTGVNMALSYFLGTVEPVAQALGARFGSHFTYTDVGWPGFSSYAFSSPWVFLVIAIEIIVNLVMLFTNMTDTLNLNIWDCWHTTITTLVVLAVTDNNIPAAIVCAACSCALSLFFTDWFANSGYIKNYFGMDNIAYFQGCNAWWAIFAEGCSKLMDKLHIADSGKFTPATIQEKFGVIGEPTVLGGIIGLIMGIAAGLPWNECIMLGINLACCLLVLPMMVGIVVQALIPLSEAAGNFTRKVSKGKKNLYVGVDVALACGDETVMAVSTIMIPVMLILFLIVPGSCFMPLADLGSLCFFVCWMVAANKGDLVRTLITAVLSAIVAVFTGMFTAPLVNAAAKIADPALENDVTSLFLSYDNDILVFGSAAKASPVVAMIVAIACVAAGVALRVKFLSKRNKEAVEA